MITKNTSLIIELLKKNEVVSIPTETVYGLAGNALNDFSVEKIYSLKNRPSYNPLILHIGSFDQLKTIARDIPQNAMLLARHFWPGPLTLVLKKQPIISDVVTSGKNTVAIRMPDHPLTLEILKRLDFPLAAPSANPFGMISPTTASHVDSFFGDSLEAILDGGECEKGIESTIIGFENDEPVLYRSGAISIDEINSIIGHVGLLQNNDEIKSPGMLGSHYAPRTTTYLTEKLDEMIESFRGKKIGLLLFKDPKQTFEVHSIEILSDTGDLAESARNLYAAMHRLDNLNLDVIIAQELPETGLGISINDRLRRASRNQNENP